jgi:hypothetical protein
MSIWGSVFLILAYDYTLSCFEKSTLPGFVVINCRIWGWNILSPGWLTLQISRAHKTLTIRLAQSAKTHFNKRPVQGVGYICLLGCLLAYS